MKKLCAEKELLITQLNFIQPLVVELLLLLQLVLWHVLLAFNPTVNTTAAFQQITAEEEAH